MFTSAKLRFLAFGVRLKHATAEKIRCLLCRAGDTEFERELSLVSPKATPHAPLWWLVPKVWGTDRHRHRHPRCCCSHRNPPRHPLQFGQRYTSQPPYICATQACILHTGTMHSERMDLRYGTNCKHGKTPACGNYIIQLPEVKGWRLSFLWRNWWFMATIN